ncbi:MAG: hypothetical protein WAL63_02225 [Solirubrobacteraceae bacterium]
MTRLPGRLWTMPASLSVLIAIGVWASPGSASTAPGRPTPCDRAVLRQRPLRAALLSSPPPIADTALLGVLRRPATAADRLPAVARRSGLYSGIWAADARQVAAYGASRFVLFPGRFVDRLPRVCRNALSLRARRRMRDEDRAQGAGSVGLAIAGRQALGGGVLPFSVSGIGRGELQISIGQSRQPAVRAFAVVPDGVASVTVAVRGGATVRAAVADNFFLTPIRLRFRSPETGERVAVLTTTWYSAGGERLKSFRTDFRQDVITIIDSPVKHVAAGAAS